MRSFTIALFALFAFISGSFAQPASFVLEPFASGFNEPVDLNHCGDDRIFVVEKDGKILIMDQSGTVNPTPFLDINARVGSSGSEQGLLGLDFHPHYAQNGYFYVNYTDNSGDTKVSRFSVTGNPDVADPNSEVILFTVVQPFSNHNGGCLRFGGDGYLYIGMGDGGSGGDPGNRAQNKLNKLGKMLRIDVDHGSPYAVPVSNPFFGDALYTPDIWALGVRNPWRFSFDRSNGDLWIGDVGQDAMEEVDYQPGSSTGGENYGWRCYEGTNTYNTSGCSGMGNYDFPVFTYVNNAATGCAITGGFIYRGSRYPSMYGYYFTADYCTGKFWWVTQSSPGIFTNNYIGQLDQFDYVAFGEDQYGEVYVTGLSSGNIWHLADTTSGCTPVADVFAADSSGFCTGLGDSLRCAEGFGFTYQWLLNGTPIGGATAPAIVPASSGSYSVIVTNGPCADTSSAVNITVGAPPTVSASGLAANYCTDDASETLVGSPAGGTFIGPGMSGDVFNPATAGAGTHTIYYYYMSPLGCDGTDTIQTIVTVCAGLNTPSSGFPFSLSPNPTQGELYLNFSTEVGKPLTWKVVNLAGATVMEGEWNATGGNQQQMLTVDLPAGLYLFEISNGDTRGTRRFAVTE